MTGVNDLRRLAVEYWRISRMTRAMLREQPPNAARQYDSQLRYSARQVERLLAASELVLVEHDGAAYSPNLPVTVLNKDDYPGQRQLRVQQTLEPTVLHQGRVLELGRVLVEPVAGDAVSPAEAEEG